MPATSERSADSSVAAIVGFGAWVAAWVGASVGTLVASAVGLARCPDPLEGTWVEATIVALPCSPTSATFSVAFLLWSPDGPQPRGNIISRAKATTSSVFLLVIMTSWARVCALRTHSSVARATQGYELIIARFQHSVNALGAIHGKAPTTVLLGLF